MKKEFIKELNEPGNKNGKALRFIFQGNNLLVYSKDNTRCTIPSSEDFQELGIQPLRSQYLGRYGGNRCYSAEVSRTIEPRLPGGMFFANLIGLYDALDNDLFQIAGYAFQIMRWDQIFQYCGRCGAKTGNLENERAKICDACKLVSYPRISPAVIVAVVKENKILLARAARFTRDMYSVLAGFVEAGETLEECAQREIKEEAGIEIENITYFGSQSWPFPDSLMVGFTAGYKSGELVIDKNELVDAGWYTADNLPKIPGKLSIARELIDWFIERNKYLFLRG